MALGVVCNSISSAVNLTFDATLTQLNAACASWLSDSRRSKQLNMLGIPSFDLCRIGADL